MKKMMIFEPAMCCSTGVCGPTVNPDLVRISAVADRLKSEGALIERFNLSENQQAFLNNKEVSKILNTDGVRSLPITVVDGKVVKTNEYPSNEEIINLLNIPKNSFDNVIKENSGTGGCCDDGTASSCPINGCESQDGCC